MKQVKNSLGKILLACMLLAAAAVCLFPFVVLVTHSFMGSEELQDACGGIFSGAGSVRLHLVPEYFTLTQYWKGLFTSTEFYDLFLNNVAIALPILGGSVLFTTLTGYGFAQYRVPFKRFFLFLYLLTMLLPYQITMIPQFILLARMSLIGSRWSIWLACLFNPLGTYLMYHFAKNLPGEILESARLDGASEWGVFWRTALPNLKAGIASAAVLTLIDTWNMVEQPMVFLQDRTKYPLTLLLAELGRSKLDTVFVYTLIGLIPVVLVFLSLREYLVQGIETAYVKE